MNHRAGVILFDSMTHQCALRPSWNHLRISGMVLVRICVSVFAVTWTVAPGQQVMNQLASIPSSADLPGPRPEDTASLNTAAASATPISIESRLRRKCSPSAIMVSRCHLRGPGWLANGVPGLPHG